MHYTTKLLTKESLTGYFEKRKKNASKRAATKKIRPNSKEFLWIHNFIEEYKLTPITINFENKKLQYQVKRSDPEKVYILIKVPYTGSKPLCGLQPDGYSVEKLPNGTVGCKFIILNFEADIFESNELHKSKHDKCIKVLVECLEIINEEVVSFNEWVKAELIPKIESRFDYVRRCEEVAGNYLG